MVFDDMRYFTGLRSLTIHTTYGEDLSFLSRGRIESRAAIPYYGLFVLFVFSLFISGIIRKPFAFNEYSSLIFMPLMVLSIAECVKILKKR